MNNETNDVVNHPDHYIFDNGIETFDYICAVTKDLQGEEAVCVANIIKYISRFNKKNGKEDLDKAAWYLDKLRGISKENSSNDVSSDTSNIIVELINGVFSTNNHILNIDVNEIDWKMINHITIDKEQMMCFWNDNMRQSIFEFSHK